MKKAPLFIRLALSLMILGVMGCRNSQNTYEETPTRGKIKIASDGSFKLLMDTELFTFQSLYTYAHISPLFGPEGDVIASLMSDSVPLVVVTRKLTDAETQLLGKKNIIPRTTKIAHDAIAIIINKNNPDSLFRYDQLQAIFDGKILHWKDINPKSSLSDLIVVFDSNKSGNFRFIKEKFFPNKPAPSNCFAVNSNAQVLEYVKDKPNAIGIIGVNWISDRHDTISHNFLQDMRVVSIGSPGDTEGKGEFRKPFQGYIAEGSYPLTRDVYVICRETFAGLGTGFSSFLAGDQGQRIILKSGLVPATMPVRLVQIKK